METRQFTEINRKVPMPGTMTKRQLKSLINRGQWATIGLYFNFTPKFLLTETRRPTFDWCSCPPAMTALLQSKTEARHKREVYRASRLPYWEVALDIKRRLHEAQGGRCYYCGELVALNHLTREHKTPRCKGGGNGDNVVGACKNCNGAKGNLTFEEFLSTDYLEDDRRLALGFNTAATVKWQKTKYRGEKQESGAVRFR